LAFGRQIIATLLRRVARLCLARDRPDTGPAGVISPVPVHRDLRIVVPSEAVFCGRLDRGYMWWSDVTGITKTAAEIYRLCVVAIYISGAQIDNQIVSVWDAPASAGDVDLSHSPGV